MPTGLPDLTSLYPSPSVRLTTPDYFTEVKEPKRPDLKDLLVRAAKPNGSINWAQFFTMLSALGGISAIGAALGGSKGALATAGSGLKGLTEGYEIGRKARAEEAERVREQGLAASTENQRRAEILKTAIQIAEQQGAEAARVYIERALPGEDNTAIYNAVEKVVSQKEKLAQQKQGAEAIEKANTLAQKRAEELNRLKTESRKQGLSAPLLQPMSMDPADAGTSPLIIQSFGAPIPFGQLTPEEQSQITARNRPPGPPTVHSVYDKPTGQTDSNGDPITEKWVVFSDGTHRKAEDVSVTPVGKGLSGPGPRLGGYVSPVQSGLAGEVMKGISQGQQPVPTPMQTPAGATPKPFNEKAAIDDLVRKLTWTQSQVEAAVVANMKMGLTMEQAVKKVALDNNVLLKY